MACRAGGFGLGEQLWMQLSFHGVWILGALAMSAASPLLAAGYVAVFPVIGVVFLIMRRWVCPRCPHLWDHGACVQLHPALARRLVGRRAGASPLTAAGRIGFYVALYGLVLVPLPWVVGTRSLLLPYLVVAAMHYGGYHGHLCRRCLNLACPQHPASRAR